MTDERTKLTWHTLWNLIGIVVGFLAVAVEMAIQYQGFIVSNAAYHEALSERLTKVEIRMELIEKHMENIQYQLDHERTTH